MESATFSTPEGVGDAVTRARGEAVGWEDGGRRRGALEGLFEGCLVGVGEGCFTGDEVGAWVEPWYMHMTGKRRVQDLDPLSPDQFVVSVQPPDIPVIKECSVVQ